jgi:elongator complex protein 2
VEAINWTQPPLESQLADNTLWLETKKMFGHNNEVVCMKMSHNGKWLASSSKARYTHSCHVIIWSVQSQELLAKLEGHESTVVCVDFSSDGK